MPKKKVGRTRVIEIPISDEAIIIRNMDDAAQALSEMEEISQKIVEAQIRSVDLKKAVTAWAVDKKVDVIQVDGAYYRQIQRHNRGWDLNKVKELVKGKKGPNGKPLFNFITRRVIDPEKIDLAVKRGLITEKKIQKAFVETPQTPFLQRFVGDAIDG